MKSVLLPIDGSECSLRGIDLIIAKRARYANPNELGIHLVNVQPPLPQDVTRFASHQQVSDFHREESDRQTATARQRLEAANVPYAFHHRVGHVAEEIVALSQTLGCDQIVMGTHGRSAFAEFLMGSVTAKVIHLSKIPILLVK